MGAWLLEESFFNLIGVRSVDACQAAGASPWFLEFHMDIPAGFNSKGPILTDHNIMYVLVIYNVIAIWGLHASILLIHRSTCTNNLCGQ